MRLLAGQGGIIGASLCTSDFWHPRHSTVPQACSQSCQTSCQTLSQKCSQACSPGGSQACSWIAHSCGPCGAYAALQSQILPPEKVAHRACFPVELNTHPNRQFPAHFVVHTPLCLHVFFRVARPLHSNRECEGTVTWGILGYVPSEGTVVQDRSLRKGGAQYRDVELLPCDMGKGMKT